MRLHRSFFLFFVPNTQFLTPASLEPLFLAAQGSRRGTQQPGDESFVGFEVVNAILFLPCLLSLDVLQGRIVGQIVDQDPGLRTVFVTCYGGSRWMMFPCGYPCQYFLPFWEMFKNGRPVALFFQGMNRLFDDDGVALPRFFFLFGQKLPGFLGEKDGE